MIQAMAQWLVKEEPENYAYDRLERDGRTVWAGVKNPVAQKHLRAIRRGERIFYYHTGKEKAVVAIARAASDAYPDPNDASGRLSVVEVAPDRKLRRPVTLAEIKADGAFAASPLVRIPRLSVMPMSEAEWARVEALSRS
jgi:predicted RNA-binding protein with PUA-like domain